ncbi:MULTISPECIES: CHAD domain-containing protein [Calditerrivibrio]
MYKRQSAVWPHTARYVKMKEYLGKQLDTILNLVENVINYDKQDALHDFRVALRRFLVVFNILAKVQEPPVGIQQSVDIFKNIRSSSNKLRDLEVLKEHILNHKFDTEFGEKGKSNLLTIIDRKIHKEHEELLQILLNANLTENVKNFREYIFNLQIQIDSTSYIKKFLKRIKKALSEDPTDDTIHMIRVNFKKIRYIMEMTKNDDKLIDSIKNMQELLGTYNDLRIGISILNLITEEKIVMNKSYLYAIGYLDATFLYKKIDLRRKIIENSKKLIKLIKNHISSFTN